MNKEIRKMVEAAEAQGFRVESRKSAVIIYGKRVEDGMVTLHRTPSGGKRSIQNARGQLRRIGVAL